MSRIVDCERHVAVLRLEDLYPYMSSDWVDRFRRTGFLLPAPERHPGGSVDKSTGARWTDFETISEDPDVGLTICVPHQAIPTAGWCETYLTAIYASALNAYFLDRGLPKSPDIRYALAISPHEPEMAVDEIARHASNPLVAAIVMPLVGINMGQRHYRPILKAAARHKLPVIVHPSGYEGNVPGTPLLGGVGPRFEGEYDCLISQVAAINIASLVYDGAFVDLPDLTVIFSGVGYEWLPPFIWRADSEWRNLRIDIPWVTKPPSAYIADNVRVMVDPIDVVPPEMMGAIFKGIPETTLIYGSNRPFNRAAGADVIRAFPEEVRDKVAFANAAATFRGLVEVTERV
ncbi:MAG: amidohydrolase family protein [Flavobacteriaceae bacterium]